MILRYNFFTILWGILILIFTLSPGGAHTVEIYGSDVDKTAHGLLFCVFSTLLTIGLSKQYTYTYVRFNAIKVSFIVSNLYGLLVECGQLLVPQRGFEFWDLLANLIGILVGLFIFFIVYKL